MPTNTPVALEWLHKSAKGGYSVAQHQLGIFFRDGRHMEKDRKAAISFFEKAAAKGYGPAQNDLDALEAE